MSEPEKTPRTNASKALHLIGAILRSGREGDKRVRRSLQGWIAFLTGGGFAVYAATILLHLVADQIRMGWRLEAERQQAQVEALREIAQVLRDQKSAIDQVGDRVVAAQAQNTTEHGILIDRVQRGRR